jgi:hypothetical protein
VRDLIDETSAQFWTDTQLNEWLNQGCQDIARRWETLWKVQNVAVTQGVQDYPAPTDFIRFHRIEFLPTANVFIYPLVFQGYNEMDSAWGVYQSFPAAWPTWWTLKGNTGQPGQVQLTIRLFPVPAQPGTLNIYYYRNAIAAVADTDPIDCLAGWEDLVYEYAIYKAKRKDNDPTWQDAYNFYEQRGFDLARAVGTFTDQPNTFSSGQAQWPPWAFGDSDWS